MADFTPLKAQFNAGEISPLLAARVDVAGVVGGCSRLENFVALPQGPVTRRPGFRQVASIKDPESRAFLARFVFNLSDAYILELGETYIRFFAEGAPILDGDDPLEVATPWTVDDLTTDEGTLRPQMAGVGDRLFMVHGDTFPQVLERQSALAWTLADAPIDDGPWADLNATGTTLKVSSTTGSVTLTANSALFTPDHVGVLVRLWIPNDKSVQAWVGGESTSSGVLRYSDGKYYRAQNTATTGTVKPIHDDGQKSDGGVDWRYEHSGYGWCRITGYTDSTHVTATIISTMPSEVSGSDTTKRWQFGAWGKPWGFPSSVGFAFGRLCFARGNQLWFSQPDDYFSFANYRSGSLQPDDAVALTVKDTVQIRWLQSLGRRFLVGTERDERQVVKLTETDAFGPTNADIVPASTYGSRKVRPVEAHGACLFVQRQGRKIRAQEYKLDSDGLAAADLTLMAEHMLRESPAAAIAWQASPAEILWTAREDGLLVGMTWHPQQDVLAWHRHPLGGDGAVESIEVLPTPSGDQVWCLIRRGDRCDVQVMTPLYEPGNDRATACFADGAISYDGAPTWILTGLDHLEGQTVGVMADGGAEHPDRIVEGGEIALQRQVTQATIGVRYRSLVEVRNLEAGARQGTAQSRMKRAWKVFFRVLASAGIRVGAKLEELWPLDRRTPRTPMGTPEPLITGDVVLDPWPAGHSREEAYLVVGDTMQPLTLLAIIPETHVEG